MSERFLFLHGGPGFNGFPERTMLGPLWEAAGHQIAFWNEPSRLRPEGDAFEAEGAFERWLASAERFVMRSSPARTHIIAHSCTVHAALEIARRHPERFTMLTLVAPSVDNFATFRNVLRLAGGDLADGQPEVASAIASALARSRVFFDESMREGLQLSARDERLFAHYFANADQRLAAAAASTGPEAQFDAESFFAVLSDFAARSTSLLSTGPVSVPVLALFGSADPITPMDEQVPALRAAVPDVRIECVDGCSHFLHLDRPRRFLEILLDADSTSSSRSPSPRNT
jgi:pimeloyl-ACP methyl ester carboxylesterase